MVRKQSGKSSQRNREKRPSSSGAWKRVQQLVWQRSRVLVALAVVGLLGWGMQALWQRHSASIIHRDQYLLADQDITISPTPVWIQADVRAEAVRNSGIDCRLSILEDDFVSVIRDAFELHPWVESVDSVTKRFPPAVHVELAYRRPVAVVEMGEHLLPVDKYGIHLPESDVPEIRKRYLPRIGGVKERPPTGQHWEDPRVLGAVDLADRLLESWDSLCLVDILPSAMPEIRGQRRFFVFDLITRGGTRIAWGAAPSTSPPTEDAFDTKLKRLRGYVDRHGPLDSIDGPAAVDVRRGLDITPRTVKRTSPRDATAVVK